MNAIEIKPNIYWVGVVDWGVRDFHGYITPERDQLQQLSYQ